jgi:hypothetical protein
MIQIPKLLGTSLSIREDEAEDGVQAWTRPLGSGLPVSTKMKQRRTAWRRGRVPSAPACPKLQAYDLTAYEPDGAGDVRPGRADVRRRRGGRAARMSDAAGAAGRRGCPTLPGRRGRRGCTTLQGRRDGGDVRRRWAAGILLAAVFTGGRALGTDATGYVRRLCPCE